MKIYVVIADWDLEDEPIVVGARKNINEAKKLLLEVSTEIRELVVPHVWIKDCELK